MAGAGGMWPRSCLEVWASYIQQPELRSPHFLEPALVFSLPCLHETKRRSRRRRGGEEGEREAEREGAYVHSYEFVELLVNGSESIDTSPPDKQAKSLNVREILDP